MEGTARQIERQLEERGRGWKREDRAVLKGEEEMERERAVTDYVRRGRRRDRASSRGESVKEGILARYRKRRGTCGGGGSASAAERRPPRATIKVGNVRGWRGGRRSAYLMMLSGEVSAFDLPLDGNDGGRRRRRSCASGAYVEYTLRTTASRRSAGRESVSARRPAAATTMAGVPPGIAIPADDVGADCASYGYDGSRGLVFHGGGTRLRVPSRHGEEKRPSNGGRDVLGCYCEFSEPEEEENAGNGTSRLAIL
ncbi:hypothetical protein ACHAW5_001566 [Stephanodiscus triporus]|uniref:Uncharacterized protein n=1 Tax=Stephanodiscus triporus TaxID=2934178 RepID=A0ABD3NI70_9STRA